MAITQAGDDPKVSALVYVSAFAPEIGISNGRRRRPDSAQAHPRHGQAAPLPVQLGRGLRLSLRARADAYRAWGARSLVQIQSGAPCARIVVAFFDAGTPGARKRRCSDEAFLTRL